VSAKIFTFAQTHEKNPFCRQRALTIEEKVLEVFSAKITSLYHLSNNGADSIVHCGRSLKQPVILLKVK
jgi:hypothetical protein